MRVQLLLPLLLTGILAHAQEDTTRAPVWTLRTQFAGYQGTVGAGILWNVPDGRAQVGLLYGFSAPQYDLPAFHGLALRLTGSWFSLDRSTIGRWHLSPTMAITGLLELGDLAYLSIPKEYPDGYYPPQAFHALLSLGGRVGRIEHGKGWSFSVETVALDTYLWYAISQRETPFLDAWSLALGAEFHFSALHPGDRSRWERPDDRKKVR
ncbi:MAG: hypothetical protein KDB88_05780 [Flavobacteriales bacterium]|nr:hypothetical protein [Flavobacteriales bacterium]